MIRRALFFRSGLLAALAVGSAAPCARADSLVIANLTYSNVRVTDVKGDTLYFSINGQDRTKPLAQITRINLDNEPALNAAEEAFAAKNWDKATDGYDKALRSASQPWLRRWCTGRLLESASKGGRFDVAIKAMIEMARSDPASAAAVKLTMPRADSVYITDAIKVVNDALADPAAKPAMQEVLLRLLSELYNAKNDVAGAAAAAERLVQMKAAADPNSPEAQRAAILLKLKTLHVALTAKDYAKVIQTVQKDGAMFVDLSDQADALWCLAEAKAAQAGDSHDSEVWKDVAVSYMRVVVTAPASPLAGPALLKTADIHAQRLGDAKAAAAIYKQVVVEYKDQPVAVEAEKRLSK